MKQKCLALGLALALVFALAAPAGAYNDLEGHWAKEDLEELAERGFFSGYGDGSMRPDKALTLCEALVILSRFYRMDETAKSWIVHDYGAVLDAALPANLSWAREALGVCLAAGIVKESEIRKLDLSSLAEKEELAVFIVRTLRMTDKATSMASADLAYTDAESITLSYRGYVSVLTNTGIVGGDESGKFAPKATVTRAMAATMIARALRFLEGRDTVLTLPDYEGVRRAEGFLQEVGEDYLTLRSFAGPVSRYGRSASAMIYVNGVECTLNADYRGCSVTLYIRDGSVFKVATETGASITWASGSVASRHVSEQDHASSYVSVGGKYYSPGEGAAVYRDGKLAALASVSPNDYAVLKLVGGRIDKLYAYSTPVTVVGTISRLSYASTVDLRVKDAEGTEWEFPLSITDLPEFLHGEGRISLDRLSVGDEVTVAMSGTKVASIALMDSVAYITGTLSSILTTADGTEWFLALPDGGSAGYLLEEHANAYNGGAAIAVSTVGIGDEVTLSVAGNMITKIELLAASPSVSKVSGTVLGVDRTGVLTLLSGGRLVYAETDDAVLLSALDGTSVSVRSLDENTAVTAFGAFTSSNRFAATVVVVE